MPGAALIVGTKVRKGQGIADLQLVDELGVRICELDVEYSRLATLGKPNSIALDFLLLASSIYALDKSCGRDRSKDRWTRSFSLRLPVTDPPTWRSSKRDLVDCLQFLTGDNWKLEFEALSRKVLRKERRGGRSQRPGPFPDKPNTVCLFSGGLDSLVGAIDLLEGGEGRIILVGHHDGDMGGPFRDQKAIFDRLSHAYPNRLSRVFVRVGQHGGGGEITLRSRSLLFVALGLIVASALAPESSIVIPENGTIALNVPLTPSRRGSCSTRTAHPEYLRLLSSALVRLGFEGDVVNPLGMKTKGEVVAQCRNQKLLEELAAISVSCAKRSHRREWVRRTANGCGRCMPCIYRRAALHSAAMDSEVYGFDICADEVPLGQGNEGANDLKACISFLRQNPSREVIAQALLANGSLDVQKLDEYADLVLRAMDEIRRLLADKGSGSIRAAAGLSGA